MTDETEETYFVGSLLKKNECVNENPCYSCGLMVYTLDSPPPKSRVVCFPCAQTMNVANAEIEITDESVEKIQRAIGYKITKERLKELAMVALKKKDENAGIPL